MKKPIGIALAAAMAAAVAWGLASVGDESDSEQDLREKTQQCIDDALAATDFSAALDECMAQPKN